MLKEFSQWLYAFSHGWVALCALLIFLSFGALVLPGQSAADLRCAAGFFAQKSKNSNKRKFRSSPLKDGHPIG